MAAKDSGSDVPKKLKNSVVLKYIKSYRKWIKYFSRHCESTLEKITANPNSPIPDSFLSDLSEAEFCDSGERIYSAWRDVELDDDEIERQMKELQNEIEEEISEETSLLGATAAAKPTKLKLKRLFSFKKKHRKPAPKKRSHSHSRTTEDKKSITERLTEFVCKEYDHLKELKRSIGQALGSREVRRSPRSSIPKTNTPVVDDPFARAIEDMIREVHFPQISIKMLKSRLDMFQLKFYYPEDGIMSDREIQELQDEMTELAKVKLATEMMIRSMDEKLRKEKIFIDGARRYEEQLRKGAFGEPSPKRDEAPEKIQRKRLTVDDDYDAPIDLYPSPAKHAKKRDSGDKWQEPKVGKLVDLDSPVEDKGEPKVGKLVDLDSPVKDMGKPLRKEEKEEYDPFRYYEKDEKDEEESEESDDDSKDDLASLIKKTSM